MKGEISDKIEAIEEITEEDNLKDVSFLLDLAREASFSTALRALAKRIKELSDDYSDNLNTFSDKFCFFEKKSKLRMGYNIMNVIKREIRDGLRNRYLFSWGNVPGAHNGGLLKYLVDDLGIGWAGSAKIRKSDDGKTIHIFRDVNSARIMIDEVEENATLKISDGRTQDLKVKKEHGKLNIYGNRIWDIYADASSDPKKDWCGTLRGYLFCWNNVPGDDNDKLKIFLKDEFDIEWAGNAEIHKSNADTTINISKNENSIEIMMDAKKEKATLKISDGRTYDLKVKNKGEKLNIHAQVNRISGNDRNILNTFSEILETFIKSENYSKLLLECVIEEEIKNRYLFSIDAKFEDDLNNGILSEELKNIFKTKEFPLSENAKVIEEKKEKKRVITNEEKFIISKEDGMLNIYNDILDFTNNAIFTYGYSVSILNVLDVIDSENKRKMDIYLIKTEDKATIFEEDAKIRKRLTANYYLSPSIYSVKEIMSMDLEDFRGRDMIFLLGIELINEDNLALQTYNAGIIIEKIIRKFKKDEDKENKESEIKVILVGESYKVFDFRNDEQINERCVKSSLIYPEYINYIFTDHGLHVLDKNGYWTVLREHKQVNNEFKYKIYNSACYCKREDNPKNLSCS